MSEKNTVEIEHLKIVCTVDVYTSMNALNTTEQQLIVAATQALEGAYAPYSQFKVGCAILLENGIVVRGNNQENAAYPSGLCAERVAFYSASSNYPTQKIVCVAVTTAYDLPNPVAPCGACRQVMLEYELKQAQPIKILLTHPAGKIFSIASVKELLPVNFSGEWLKHE